MNDGAQQALPLEVEPVDLWEAIDDPISNREQSVGEAGESTAKVETISRETELLALIHDLNECNDALLSRVTSLEKTLEQTQAASKAEVEKAQAAVKTIQARTFKQVSAEHASVQQISQNAQQQVAKVVTQLETTEQALGRQQLINENLQTELDNSLERIVQLERDCALNAQQHAEEAKARVKAETASRDLKARLQRQQRYTLQFKAALEKSLTVSSRAEGSSIKAEVARPVPFKDTASVVMPKAQRIMPWASVPSNSPFQGIDPHLETLIRSVGKPSEPEVPVRAEVFETVVSEPAVTRAEAKLWQDLEQVMGTATADKPAAAVREETAAVEESAVIASAETVVAPAESVIATPEPKETGTPKLNWQTNRKAAEVSAVEINTVAIDTVEINTTKTSISEAETSETMASEAPPIETAKRLPVEPQITPVDVETSFAAATRQRLETAVTFTEPSPWGKPLPQKVEAMPAAAQVAISQPLDQSLESYDYLPATESTTDSTIAPVVKPLHPQKKIGSLASVELPTFPNAKVGSFKR